ncbi:hypothetical protein [Haloprofundus halobius]|nr:hypothetical protein [Haloprofundus halobius]
MPYELDCTGCSFQKTVVGGVNDVYDAIEGHRTNCGGDPLVHLVEFVKTN